MSETPHKRTLSATEVDDDDRNNDDRRCGGLWSAAGCRGSAGRDAVLRLLRGEDLETLSRTLDVTAATLSGWRDTFLSAGEASLATRPLDAGELESDRLKARLGEMLLERELLEARIVTLEGGRPLVRRRSRR